MALAWGTHLGTLPCVFRATWFAIVMHWLSASWFRPLYVPLWGAHPSSGHYLPQASAKRLRGHWCCPMPTLNFSSAFDAEVSHQRLFLCPVPRAGRPARHLRPHGHQACHRHDAPAPCLGLRVGMAGSAMLRLSTHSAGAAWAPRAQKADRGSSGGDHPRPDGEENRAAQRHSVAWDGNQHPAGPEAAPADAGRPVGHGPAPSRCPGFREETREAMAAARERARAGGGQAR